MVTTPSPHSALVLSSGDPLARAMTMDGIAALTGPAVRLVMQERMEQVERHGHTCAHDDQHRHGEIAYAARAYVTASFYDEAGDIAMGQARTQWPFAPHEFRPGTPIECLVKAAAMLLAEIDRLHRVDAVEAIDLFSADNDADPA